MSEFNQKAVTDKGLTLSANALNGDVLTFTRIALGSGVYVGDFSTVADLANQEVSLDLKGIAINGNEVVLSSTLLPNALTSSFAWSELGVFAKGADDVEVLYFYANATNTSYIDKDSLDEKIINVALLVENTSNITALIDSGLVYATQVDIESHNTSTNAHQDIRDMIQNIDLTSVIDKVTLEAELTKARINLKSDEIKTHVTNEINRNIMNTDSRFDTSTNNINKQHTTTKNHVTVEVANAKKELKTMLESLKSSVANGKTSVANAINDKINTSLSNQTSFDDMATYINKYLFKSTYSNMDNYIDYSELGTPTTIVGSMFLCRRIIDGGSALKVSFDVNVSCKLICTKTFACQYNEKISENLNAGDSFMASCPYNASIIVLVFDQEVTLTNLEVAYGYFARIF